MQTESQLDLMNFAGNVSPLGYFIQVVRLLDLRNDLEKREHAHVSYLVNFGRVMLRYHVAQSFIKDSLRVLKPPNKQKAIPNVFICCSLESVHSSMHYICDFIYENNYPLLQQRSKFCEFTDVTEAEDANHFRSRDHRVYLSLSL